MRLRPFALVASLFVGAASSPAHASCNAIPESPLMFRGELGSIDRPFVSPDSDEVVTVHSVPGLERSPGLSLKDVRITLFFKPPAEAPSVFFIAGNNKCRALEEPACFLERLFCHRPRTCFTGSSVHLTVSAENGHPQYSFRFPDTGAAGPVTIAVTSASQPPPIQLWKETCEAQKPWRRADLAVCIDRFAVMPDPPGDPTFTELVALPSSYDYRKVCTPTFAGDPKCSGSEDYVSYTVTSQGDVLMPVSWSNILRVKKGSQDLDLRVLHASTAVEAILGQGNRIFIPSLVFLETTTQQGGGFSPNPVFAPTQLPGRPNEQSFTGTADKNKSVLKFARRKLWDQTCDGGGTQPCEPDSASTDCTSAKCALSPLAYFACVGGGRDKLPCTRTAQCPQGACQRVSDAGSVCVGFDGKPTTTACKQDSDCGTNAECGPGLFEFRNRTVKGLGTLKRVAMTVPGVCDGGTHNGDPCTTASTCNSSFFGSVKCVTYRAEALPYPTP